MLTVVGFGAILLRAHPVRATSRNASQGSNLVLPPNPDAVCAECHQEIYESYEKTPMASGSGVAQVGLLQGGYFDAASGVQYKVFMRDGKAWLSYDRAASSERSALHAERQLLAYLGSGGRGRAYLYAIRGQWFETDINYYSLEKRWEMAPNYAGTKRKPAPLLIDTSCLHCHTTTVQQPLPGSRNRFSGAPFMQAGVGCSACHGDPSKHLVELGAGPMVNPAKLDSKRRDSVCLQCHLEGKVAVFRAGTSLTQFRPGDDLAKYVTYFVDAAAQTGGQRAVSQYEALMHSACKRASGDKLTCITCHDPHSAPTAEQRVSYYRSKCLMCHTGVAMATRHHPEQPDCTVCHMPTRQTTDISHNELTDHDIEAQPAKEGVSQRATGTLVPVIGEQADNRSLGLAYAQLAEQGDRDAGEKALHLLQQAEKEGNRDEQVHTQLGFLEQMSGDSAGARVEYSQALLEDSNDVTAMANLAVLDAAVGQTDAAMSLLRRVIDADPSQTAAGLNLAFIECRTGLKKEALEVLRGLSELNPDDPVLRKLMTNGNYGGQHCELQ